MRSRGWKRLSRDFFIIATMPSLCALPFLSYRGGVVGVEGDQPREAEAQG